MRNHKVIAINSVQAWQDLRASSTFSGKRVGFVPTMGHLHKGHESLLQRAQMENDIVVLSIFINPAQFNQSSDYKSYPRTWDQDLMIAQKNLIPIIFAPTKKEMYPLGNEVTVEETTLSQPLEGPHRPGHFCGVLTIVLKLLNLVQPHKVYFGEKDYQQFQIIDKMVKSLFLTIQVICCSTVRAASGLALSSRNSHLNAEQLEKAAIFSKLLQSAKSNKVIIADLMAHGFTVDYIQTHQGRRYGAAWLNQVRLIDNCMVG